jgi:crotonobetainyl-CoA:carnitine CoA-transferase CaiB-like acyl-CoA transferase
VSKPLEGFRILDLTRLLPGPALSMHLADLGADVIKVEDTADGDYMRSFPPLARNAEGVEVNASFENVNRGKRSVALDLKKPLGRDALLRLADGADALVEGFRPGVMERLGLGWDVLRARNPRLVFCSLTGYGQSGPWRLKAGHDLNYCAVTGVLDQIRTDDGRAAMPNLQIGDLLGGTLSALSTLLAALLGAQRSGRGSRVDAAMTDGLLVHHVFPHAELDAGRVPQAGRTLLTGGAPCYRIYETADGRLLAVGALELKFWQVFCDAAGLAGLRDRHWSLGLEPGSAASDEVAQQVAARIRERTCAEWESVFAAIDACVTPVLSPAEALSHPHHLARGLVHKRGSVTAVGPLAAIDDGLGIAPGPAPRAGQHTREVLAEAGFGEDEIAALLASGAALQAAG